MVDVTVVGIGADGWPGLAEPGRRAIASATVLLGSTRQLELLPAGATGARRLAWPSPLLPILRGLLEQHAGPGLCVLASGDPMFFGIGSRITGLLGPERVHVIPHVSSVSLACARLGWPVQDTVVASAVGRPLADVAGQLRPGRRLLVLSQDADTPDALAALLREHGYGTSSFTVLAMLGSAQERIMSSTAARWDDASPVGPLTVVAVHCFPDYPRRDDDPRGDDELRRDDDRLPPDRPAVPAVLPDERFRTDGQLTKSEIRALTLAALAPRPGELLWDVGTGSGSVAVDWLRADPACQAIGIDRDPDRVARAEANARSLGVPRLRVIAGVAPAALAGLPRPSAIFIGGGASTPGLLAACLRRLAPGGRLVVNAVSLAGHAMLIGAHTDHGGVLRRISIERAGPLGAMTAWRPALPLTQWIHTSPRHAERDDDDERDDAERGDDEQAGAEQAGAGPGPTGFGRDPGGRA